MDKSSFLKAVLNSELKCKIKYFDGGIAPDVYNFDIHMYNNIEIIVPIIRNITDLSKECSQSNYNNGKPFIPIVELAKLGTGQEYEKFHIRIENETIICTELIKSRIRSKYYPHVYFEYDIDDAGFCYCNANGRDFPVSKQLQLFILLFKWHFWPNKPESEEVVYVDKDFNPYMI